MLDLRRSPSKYSGGIASLWQGLSITTLTTFISREIFKTGVLDNQGTPRKDGVYLFESARSALACCLLAFGVRPGDEVIVSAFTCDAVTYAVLESGATPVYVDIRGDLTMDPDCVLGAVNEKTICILVQNTFGRIGLSPSVISECKSNGLLIIEDNCLSYGSKRDSESLGTYGDLTIWSLETSKVITVGWGGVLTINNLDYFPTIEARYRALKKIKWLSDLRRLAQLYLSIVLIKNAPPFGNFLWHLLYGLRLFRRSSTKGKALDKSMMKMGDWTQKLFFYVYPNFELWIDQTHKNLRELSSFAEQIGLITPIEHRPGEYLCSPRLSVLIKVHLVEYALKLAELHKIELGRWFSECPPMYRANECRIHSADTARRISEQVINIPCYWTFTDNELNKIKLFMTELTQIEQNWKG